MQKDYLSIKDNQSGCSEISLIENMWTQQWDDLVLKGAARYRIEAFEEIRIIKDYLDRLPLNARILDGGCGLGEYTVYFNQKGFNAFGIDISKKTIGRLKEKIPQYKDKFLSGDIRKTGFEDSYFDAYFSKGTFEHFENGFEECLKEAYRILKPGGYLFVAIPFENIRHTLRNIRKLEDYAANFNKKDGYEPKMRFYQWRLNKRELRQELEMNGFEVLKIKTMDKRLGIIRLIRHDFGIKDSYSLHKILRILLYPFIPSDYAAHMLMGICVKRNKRRNMR